MPDITFYFRAPLDVAVHRILSGRPKLKYYEAGMDLGLSYDRSESFRLFQARILEEYDKMVDSDNFVVLDGTLAGEQIAEADARHCRFQNRSEAVCAARPGSRMKKHDEEGGAGMPDHEKEKEKEKTAANSAAAQVDPMGGAAGGPSAQAAKGAASEEETSQYFFGEPLVGFDPSEITGSLIVIEGMDGSGRSTQIALLQEWLESEGFAVQTSGLRRSNLVGRDIDRTAGEKRGDAADAVADVRDGLLRSGRASHLAGVARRDGRARRSISFSR